MSGGRGKTAVSKGKQPVVLTQRSCVKCEARILSNELVTVLTLEPKPAGSGMSRRFVYWHKGCR